MKKNITKLLLIIMVMSFTSCYDDKSTLDTDALPELTVDLGIEGDKIKVGFNEELDLNPTILKDGKEVSDGFDYEWSMTSIPNELGFESISNEKNLKFVVDRPIANDQYVLKLICKDLNTNFEYINYWMVQVSSSYGEGILVSYTDDGATSDIALIMDKGITDGYTKDALVRKDLYEMTNNTKMPGLVSSSSFTLQSSKTPTYWFVFKDGNFISLDCEAYRDNDVEMIYKPNGFKAYNIFNCHQSMIMFANTGLFKMSKMLDKAPTVPAMTIEKGGEASNNVYSSDSYDQGAGPNLMWYNEAQSSFFAASAFQMTPTQFESTSSSSLFDCANLPNKESIAGGLSYDGQKPTFLMKDKITGNYGIYSVTRSYYGDDYKFFASEPYALVDVPESVNVILNSAVSIFFVEDQSVMYIATETDIYTLNFISSPATFNSTPVYSVASGETIAIAKLYQQGTYLENRSGFAGIGGLAVGTKPKQELTNRAIYFATNTTNGKGKVYIIPMIKNLVTTGALDTNNITTYDDFSKILDISTQGIYIP